MPAGCDFTCKNKDCDYLDTGFVINAPWPMGSIDDVMESQKVKDLPALKEQLKELKEAGRDYACITFPNKEEIETKSYRVHLWSVGGKCVWQYDVVKDGDSIEEAILKAKLPLKCPTTGSDMLGFAKAVEDGIDCPSCSKKLTQKRWFAKED